MEFHPPKTLKDVVPYVQEHLLPLIHQSVEVCRKSYLDDSFNDSWIFGTHRWKNTWNRLAAEAEFEDCPFEICGKGNEYKLRIGRFVLRHHYIDHDTRMPSGAKAVKAAAQQQMLPFPELATPPDEIDNIVIAIDADVADGLKEVFVGAILPVAPDSNQYIWDPKQKFPVYLAGGFEPSTAKVINIADNPGFKRQAPEEAEPEVRVEIDHSRSGEKTEESDPEK